MPTIKQTYHIKAPVAKVWQALVDSSIIEQWSGSPAVMDAVVGTKFKLWGNEIYGQNLEVVPEKELVQSWVTDGFDEPSEVTFQLVGRGNETTVTLIHKDVPTAKVKAIDDGWREYYLGPIKDLLEN